MRLICGGTTARELLAVGDGANQKVNIIDHPADIFLYISEINFTEDSSTI